MQVQILQDVIESDLATKRDIAELKTELKRDIKELEYRMAIKLGGLLIFGLGAMVALAKLGLLSP